MESEKTLYRGFFKNFFLTVILALIATLVLTLNCGYAADFDGKPKIKNSGSYGYYLWRDKKEMWHLATLSKDTPHTFSGEIFLYKGRFEVVEKESKGIIEKIFGLFSNTLENEIRKEAKKKKDEEKEEEGIEEYKTIKKDDKKKVEKKDGSKKKKVIRDRLGEEDVTVVNDRKMVFSFKSKDEETTFSFKVDGTTPCVKFDLKIDGKRNIRRVYLGKNRVRPKRLPFHRCR